MHHLHLLSIICIAWLLIPLHAATPPELAALQQQYEKAVLAPHQEALSVLQAKYATALENAAEAAQKTGKLDDVLALQNEQKLLSDKQPISEDYDKASETLKKLRAIYRAESGKIEESLAQSRAAKLPEHLKHLQELETTLTKAGRIEEALQVRGHREGLERSPPPVLESAGIPGSTKAGRLVVWNLKGGQVDAKLPLIEQMPSVKSRVKSLASSMNNRARYLLAVLEDGKVHGWPGSHAGVTHIPSSLKRVEHAACGYSGSAVLDDSGKLSVFGSPEKVKADDRFSSISCGSFHLLCLTSKGALQGYMLDKRAISVASVPANFGHCVSAWAGDNISLVHKADGTAWVWTNDQAPARVELENIRSVMWAYRSGTAVLKDGTCRNISTNGKTGILPMVTDTVPEGGILINDGEGHYAIKTPEGSWSFYGKDVNAEHCAHEAAGCTQIVFVGDHAFGIRP